MEKAIKNRFKQFQLLPLSFLNRETTFLGKQQLYIFVIYTIAIIIGLSSNLIGVSGPQQTFNLWLNAGYIIAAILFFVCYLCRKLPLSFSLFGIIIITQISTSVEMFYCAYTPDHYHLMLIVANLVLLSVNILFSLIAYLEYTPYILSALSVATYIICMRITENESLDNFFGIFLVIFVGICILGSRLVRNMHYLDKENVVLKKDEEELINTLGLNKEQIKTYMQLMNEKQSFDKTEALLSMLGEDVKHTLISNVEQYLSVKETGMLEMEKIFPELSASEREICLLVLQDKKLNDICAILNKKESNITSTRVHIRRKLNMKPSDNLRKVLQERAEKGTAQ